MKERFIAGDGTVVAHDQTAKIAEPCKSASDFLAAIVAAQPSAVLSGRLAAIVAMRRDQVNSSCSQALAQRGSTDLVAAFVGVWVDRLLQVAEGIPKTREASFL